MNPLLCRRPCARKAQRVVLERRPFGISAAWSSQTRPRQAEAESLGMAGLKAIKYIETWDTVGCMAEPKLHQWEHRSDRSDVRIFWESHWKVSVESVEAFQSL